VRSTDDFLYAINPDGTEKWRYPVVWGKRYWLAPAVSADGTIYFTAFDYLYALDPDGSLKWSYKTGLSAKVPAFGSDGTVYVTDTNKLFALSSEGEWIWDYQYPTSEFTDPVIGTDGTIYLGCIGFLDSWHGILAVNPNGTLEWKYETSDNVHTTLSLGYGGVIYFGTYDKYLNALYPDGTFMWRFDTRSKVYFPPSVGPDSTLYFGEFSYYFYAVDYYGNLKWWHPIRVTNSSPAIGADGTIYVEDSGSDLFAFSPEGDVLWQYPLGGGANTSPAIAPDGTIYLSGWFDKSLHAITSSSMGLANTPWPRFRHDNAHSGRTLPTGTHIAEAPVSPPELQLSVRSIGRTLLVNFTIPEGQAGVLLVYDAAGRRIDQKMVSASGQAEFSANLAGGVYWVRLKSGSTHKSAKVVLLH